METLKAIARRKSVRSFSDKRLDSDTIDTIVAAGCAAPVGMARYDTLHITIIETPEMIRAVSGCISEKLDLSTDALYGAPLLIVLSAKVEADGGNVEMLNAANVIENMLLAATDLGVGSVYIFGTAIALEMTPELKAQLGIPEGFTAVASAIFGYAAEASDSEKELKITISSNRV